MLRPKSLLMRFVAPSLLLVFCWSGLNIRSSEAAEEATRPNILWIIIDDQDPWWGCYGNDLASTPNFDRLASEGMLFQNAFAANPVCSPSHTSLLTGNYPTTLGCPHHRCLYLKDLPEGHRDVEELLREAGYFTVNMRSDRSFHPDMGAWLEIIHGASGKTDLNYRREAYPAPFEHGHAFDPFVLDSFFQGGTWENREEGQPFFAYANVETGKAHGYNEGRKWAEEQGVSVDPADVEIPPYLVDTPEWRDRLAKIHDAVSHTDHVVGKILDSLETVGHAEDTLVFIASDHGRSTMRHKQWLYDTGLQVPMIVRWPGHVEPGSVCDELTSLIDAAPTSLIAAGVIPPETMEGLNLLGDNLSQRTHVFANRDSVDGTFDMSRCIRSKQYKYIRNFYPELGYLNGNYASRVLRDGQMTILYEQGELNEMQAVFYHPYKPTEEFYDLENDPLELNNLADDPRYAKPLNELRTELATYMESVGDCDWNARELLGVDQLEEGETAHRVARVLVERGLVPLEIFDDFEASMIMHGKNRIRTDK
jgi:N-sulfoglucosamine sulfohydrolase